MFLEACAASEKEELRQTAQASLRGEYGRWSIL
jgi:hypothetical protein